MKITITVPKKKIFQITITGMIVLMLYALCLAGDNTISRVTPLSAKQGDGNTAETSDPGSAGESTVFEGYNLFSSLSSKTVNLMDNNGNTVHTWDTNYRPGNSMYLLENGELLHTGNVGNTTFTAGGAGGIVQTLDWDGNVTWSYEYASSKHLQHHDVEMLPNGNVLMIAWQHKSGDEALTAGRNSALLKDGELWPDSVIEIQPTGLTTGTIVWEWHIWDHLVQDHDSTKSNYGVVSDHPELTDINYITSPGADWNHINSIDYNAKLDQIVLSVHNFSEIWIIDHSITTSEAAGHSSGNGTKGGDLLYRWGNPQTYGAGTSLNQQLFVQHDAEWIEEGLPVEGNILIFNNGTGRPQGNYSSIEEITTPVNSDSTYTYSSDTAYGPEKPVWTYAAETPSGFYAKNISSQQRLANGNTLICDGPAGYFFEVKDLGEIVWEYQNNGQVFRVERYAPGYNGFNGTPLMTAPLSPSLSVSQEGVSISLQWTKVQDASYYTLYYAPYPDIEYVGEVVMGNLNSVSFSLWPGAAFYVAIRATGDSGHSDYSNIENFIISSDLSGDDASDNTDDISGYPIVSTNQTAFYSNTEEISIPSIGDSFYGQDGTYNENTPSYTNNGDGTITDNITGLMWEQGMGDKITYDEAFDKAYASTLGNHNDWRVPTIKELYSLILFTGQVSGATAISMFIDTDYFIQPLGNTAIGEREIDAQTWSSTEYVGLTMRSDKTVFGVNFIDGRIKGYPKYNPGSGTENTMYFRMVRGNTSYGVNDFTDNGDGTVSDNATGLMWQQNDDGNTRDWEDALSYSENLTLGEHSDWRLPNAKELQSIVDYTRCPDITNSAAIDPVFNATIFNDPEGNPGQYGYYWTGTSHLDGKNPYASAVYIAFGEAQGQMNGNLMDVHGAGAQRSDPKSGNFADYPEYWGPQGDVRYVYNYVRCVRDIK
jgi:hypothetical protein